MGELEKRIKRLGEAHQTYEGGEEMLADEILQVVEEAQKEFPNHCSAWRHDEKDDLLIEECWRCLFYLDCPIPKYKKEWFGNG